MPQIVIEIDDRQHEQVRSLVDNRQHFVVTGARIVDSDGDGVFLKEIRFVFMSDEFENLGIGHALAKPPVILNRSGPLDLVEESCDIG